MILKLTDEMRKALEAQPGEPLPLEDEKTHKRYVLIDEESHDRALQLLALQREEDLEAVRQGLAELRQGLGRPFAEVDADLRRKHGFAPRQ